MSVIAIDLFAGAGGFTEGAIQAGARVIFAANHWPDAVEYHAANHPTTEHAVQDLQQIDWRTVPPHDLLLASPACQGHSFARGKDRPHHDALRSTAWAVTSALEAHRPSAFVVENVAQFAQWELFDIWRASLERLGYLVTHQVLNAADFGVPQSRERLFIVGSRRKAITLHAPSIARVPVRSIISWEKGAWRPVTASRSPLVHLQWRNGRQVHGDRFLIGLHSSKTRGRTLDAPIGTVTTKDHWQVVDGNLYRPLTLQELRLAMGFQEAYILPDVRDTACKMLGNAVPPPMARGVIEQVMEVA